MQALLISNSGKPFLQHCQAAIADFLGDLRRVAFISAAAYGSEKEYCERVRGVLHPVGVEVEHLHTEMSSKSDLERVAAVFVGGGNSYHLLRRLHAADWVDVLRDRVAGGMPYIGSSAGSNLAGPTILTTNDWNVDGSTRFDALGFVPFNINPHYRETDPVMAPFSETREDRIAEYLCVHDNPVVGIEEQTWIRCEGDVGGETYRAGGAGRVRVFRRGAEPRDFRAGETLVL